MFSGVATSEVGLETNEASLVLYKNLVKTLF